MSSTSEETVFSCELCGNQEVSESDYVGCCRDGECPFRVEHMCEDCATFNHASAEWLCGKCDVALEEADAAETAQEELIQLRHLLGSLSSKPSSESVEQLKDLLDRAIDLCNQIQIEAGK